MCLFEGCVVLLYVFVYIEFNVINLVFDVVWCFVGMFDVFYVDWLKVVVEEVYYFMLLFDWFVVFGYVYGDFFVYNGLWEMCE